MIGTVDNQIFPNNWSDFFFDKILLRKRSMNFSADDFDIPKTTASSTASLR